jgi:hypothetical protein
MNFILIQGTWSSGPDKSSCALSFELSLAIDGCWLDTIFPFKKSTKGNHDN